MKIFCSTARLHSNFIMSFAKEMPIIDYHNHLPPDEIAADKNFENITRVWLNGIIINGGHAIKWNS
jgi:glucuronate isomerase